MGISREQALDCLMSHDLIGIGMEADAVRRRLHPEGVVTYAIDATISCARLALAAIQAQVAEAQAEGATGITLQAGALDLEGAVTVISGLRRRFPELWLQISGVARDTASLSTLHMAGLDSIVIAGTDDVSLVQHRAAHQAGMSTSATMIFGAGESTAELVSQFEAVRLLQEETVGFRAFVPVAAHAVTGRDLDDPTAVEYLKTLATARMVLDNIATVQSDWTRQGLKVLQMGLRFGANDVGPVPIQQNKGATEEELRRVIRDAGFQPAQRDLGFRLMMLA